MFSLDKEPMLLKLLFLYNCSYSNLLQELLEFYFLQNNQIKKKLLKGLWFDYIFEKKE